MSTNLITRSLKKQKYFKNIISTLFLNETHKENNAKDELLYIITKAKQEIYDAENYFDNVIAEELIDHAIYRIEAAKSKYIYLLKQAKEKGISIKM